MTAAPCRVHGIHRCTICPGLLIGAGGAFIPAADEDPCCRPQDKTTCPLCGRDMCEDCGEVAPDWSCMYLAAGHHCHDCWDDCPACAKEAHDEWEAEHR